MIQLRGPVWWRLLLWLPIPILIVVIVPWWLGRVAPRADRMSWGLWQWLGVWLILNGMSLVAWCVGLFVIKGQGTPLPLDPPRRFVVSGPYRYVRNPMLLGMWLILVGEVALFASWAAAGYTVAIMLLGHLVVTYWEEPELARRFGEPYRQYQRLVPRWIPRHSMKKSA